MREKCLQSNVEVACFLLPASCWSDCKLSLNRYNFYWQFYQTINTFLMPCIGSNNASTCHSLKYSEQTLNILIHLSRYDAKREFPASSCCSDVLVWAQSNFSTRQSVFWDALICKFRSWTVISEINPRHLSQTKVVRVCTKKKWCSNCY